MGAAIHRHRRGKRSFVNMASQASYAGVVVPMISPFTPEFAVDEPAVARITNHLLAHRVSGLFPLGTTGEAASIPTSHKRQIVSAVVQAAAGRTTIYAGIASNCYAESIEAARAYHQLGVQALVAHVPSYYTLTENQMESYFLRLADQVPLPLVIYNIPATTHHSIPLPMIDRLRHHPNIVAMKDSSGDIERISALLDLLGGSFPVLLGNSTLYARGLRRGAAGIVPSGAHLIADLYQAMMDAAKHSDWDRVDRLQQQTAANCEIYLAGRTIGQGLAALKSLLAKQGLCGPTMLPPLQDATA